MTGKTTEGGKGEISDVLVISMTIVVIGGIRGKPLGRESVNVNVIENVKKNEKENLNVNVSGKEKEKENEKKRKKGKGKDTERKTTKEVVSVMTTAVAVVD